jgi:hypothetical protein
MAMTKRCTKCGQLEAATAFHASWRGTAGRVARCKPCRAEADAQRRSGKRTPASKRREAA